MKVLLVVVVGLSLCLLSGCVYSTAPVNAAIVASEKGPYFAAPNAGASTKVGTSQAEGILIVGFGDASIATAMKNGNITKIHHIDTEVLSVIGIYARYQTVVYGE